MRNDKTLVNRLNRRDFMGAVTAAAAVAKGLAQSRSGDRDQLWVGSAPDGPVLRAGLIGCGGRGRGAALNFLDAGPHLQITALADVFPDQVASACQLLKRERDQEVPESRCFSGFDAYQKLIDSDVDIVLEATPPHFRPRHFAAAVAAGKHVFLEKPAAVDPVGCRMVMEAAEKARAKGLSVVVGTQMRYDRGRQETRARVADGAIGRILAVQCFRNQGALWYRERRPDWSEMEYMIRDWVNWIWLSGDHVVEQHIHHLDQVLWFTGMLPVKAVGMGGRARRPTGDQYDFFSTDYELENGAHMHSTIRQINGCDNTRSEFLVGSKGSCELSGTIYDLDGNLVWKYEGPRTNGIVQEHVELVTSIRTGKPVNNARELVYSTLVAIMGRDSAFTGAAVTWEEILHSDQRLGPTEYVMGPVAIEEKPPVPGAPPGRPRAV